MKFSRVSKIAQAQEPECLLITLDAPDCMSYRTYKVTIDLDCELIVRLDGTVAEVEIEEMGSITEHIPDVPSKSL